MNKAAWRLEEFLRRYPFADAGLPFVGNFSGTSTTKGNQIKKQLIGVMTQTAL